MDLETRIKRAHVTLMRHPETALYSGVMMAGRTEVSEEGITAYTDGLNKRYGKKFCEALNDQELTALVLHENLHVALRHLLHNRDLFTENRKLSNMAADYVVNQIIKDLKDQYLAKLPEGALQNDRFRNLSMREVYRLLKDEGDGGGGGGEDGEGGEGSLDEHDLDSVPSDPEQVRELNDSIDRALREGALLAGRLGADIPRAITESLEPQVDWRKELSEFLMGATSGKDEFTWRQYNRRVIDTLLLPTTYKETIGEIVVAIDTSGSIGGRQLNEFATEVASLCEMVNPERVRILWWDTIVHGEQVFETDYANIATLLKPKGGGGTKVSCVSKYINDKNVSPEALLVFTDGYLENDIKWNVQCPTLWLITEAKHFRPPSGRSVFVD